MAAQPFLLTLQAGLEHSNPNSIEGMQPLFRNVQAELYPGNTKLTEHGGTSEEIQKILHTVESAHFPGVKYDSGAVWISQGNTPQLYKTPVNEFDKKIQESKTSLDNRKNDPDTNPKMLAQAWEKFAAYREMLSMICEPTSTADDAGGDTGGPDPNAGRRKRRPKRWAVLAALAAMVVAVAGIAISIYNAVQISAMGGIVNEEVIKLKGNISSLEEGLREEQLEYNKKMGDRVGDLEEQMFNLTQRVDSIEDEMTDMQSAFKWQYRMFLKEQRRSNITMFLTTMIEFMKTDMRTLKTVLSPGDFEIEYNTDWNKMAFNFILSTGLWPEKLKKTFGTNHLYLLKVFSVTKLIFLMEDETRRDFKCSSGNYIGNLIETELPFPDPVFPQNKSLGKYVDISGKYFIWISNETFLDKTDWRQEMTVSRQRRIATHSSDMNTIILPMNNTWVLVSSDKNISALVQCDNKENTTFLHPASHTLTLKIPLSCSFESQVVNISKYHLIVRNSVATTPTPKFDVYYFSQNLNLDEMVGLTEKQIDLKLNHTHTDHNAAYNFMMSNAWQNKEDSEKQLESMRHYHAQITQATFEMIQEMKKEHENTSWWKNILDYAKGLGVTATTILSFGALAVLSLPVACISWKIMKSSKSKKAKGPQQPHTLVVTTSPNTVGIPLPSAPSAQNPHVSTYPPPYRLHEEEKQSEKDIHHQYQLA